MANDLLETTIGELCQVFDGPHATPAKTSSGPIFLGITSLNKGRLNLSASDHLSENDFLKWTRRVAPREGDVVFSYETKLGEAAIIPAGLKCCLGRRMALMRPNPQKLDSQFLLYYFLGEEFQDVIRQRTIHGSTVERLALTEFPSFPIRVPSLAVQRQVASILSALDDKIELNRQMNRTLEETAGALYRSWFVDFDPVVAKAAGRAPAHLSPALAALFPDSFQDSSLDRIPRGWSVARLADLTTKIGSGSTPRGGSAVYVDEGPALIRSQNVHDHEFEWTGLARLNAESAKALRSVEVKEGDVLLNITGDSILRTCVVDPAVLPAHVNQHVAIIRAAEGIPPHFLHLYLVQPRQKETMLGFDAGGTRAAITKGQLESVEVIKPSPEVLTAFKQVTDPWFAMIDANRTESRTLAALRDTLLPKLLSGEVRVMEVEKWMAS